MSRFLLACSLVASLSSFASADRAAEPTHAFAQAPQPHQERAPDYIQSDVAPILDRDTLRVALAKNRAANLARFRAYQKRGVFPSNTFEDKKLNVWRDADGHLCAAATIIKASGQDELVDRVADQSNFIRLADVKQGPLMNWILMSGLTQEEIAAIQEPFMPVARPQPVEPSDPVVVDARLRAAEDARLLKRYRQVEQTIVKNQKKSIELAVDRLMKHPDIAWQLVEG
jgi:hypothetical protein